MSSPRRRLSLRRRTEREEKAEKERRGRRCDRGRTVKMPGGLQVVSKPSLPASAPFVLTRVAGEAVTTAASPSGSLGQNKGRKLH